MSCLIINTSKWISFATSFSLSFSVLLLIQFFVTFLDHLVVSVLNLYLQFSQHHFVQFYSYTCAYLLIVWSTYCFYYSFTWFCVFFYSLIFSYFLLYLSFLTVHSELFSLKLFLHIYIQIYLLFLFLISIFSP